MIVLASCGAEDQNVVVEKGEVLQETVIVKNEAEEVVEDEMIESRYQYDKEWEVFKEAIINKDIKGVSAFASSDAIDDTVDEDGEKGGSTIVISFTEGEQFLELDYFLFAG